MGDILHSDRSLDLVAREEAEEVVDELIVPQVDEPEAGQHESSHLALLALVDLGDVSGPPEAL